MQKEIFDYLDACSYLLDWINSRPKRGRGSRAAIAKAIGSPISHISQVLSRISQFTPEQAEEINEFLGHTPEQAEYFLLLVQLGRAGTSRLKKRIEVRIQKIREQRLVLKNRLDVKTTLLREDQATFYSSWHYVAVHILITIPGYQSKDAIARYLGLSLKRVTEILDFMLSLGLAQFKNGAWTVGQSRIHLGSDSPMLSKHHINWRLKAIQSLENETTTSDLHYSSVVSISRQDVVEIKSLLVKAIESAKKIIKESKEEELHSFCLDLFKI